MDIYTNITVGVLILVLWTNQSELFLFKIINELVKYFHEHEKF